MIPDVVAAFDTNILVSSMLAPYGNEARAVELVGRHLIIPAISLPILDEYQTILGRPKFHLQAGRIESLLAPFLRFGLLVKPKFLLAISTHEPDNRFLECAEAASADFLITGNLRHYPATHGTTRIVNARAFLDLTGLNPA